MWDTYIIIPMTNVLLWIYDIIGHNFGVAIILFTILVRAVTWPLTAQQLKGTQGMQELQKDKEWLGIQKKYKDDKEISARTDAHLQRARHQPLWFLFANSDPISDHHWSLPVYHRGIGSHPSLVAQDVTQLILLSKC